MTLRSNNVINRIIVAQRGVASTPNPSRSGNRCRASLPAARLGLPVVAPLHERRQRHQDRFGAPARLQAEERAAVAHQVELDVAAAAVGLEVALALAVRQCSCAARRIGR